MLTFKNPLQIGDWDETVLKFQEAGPFHGQAWARLLNDAYGYLPKYLVSRQDDDFSFILPLFEINSFLTGKRAVGLPFSDYCQPLSSRMEILDKPLKYIKERAGTSGWKYFEIRGYHHILEDLPPYISYYSHVIDLDRTENALFSALRGSTRRNITRSVKQGITVTFEKSEEALNDFYNLHGLTRKKHGLPVQSKSFFRKLWRHIIAQDRGCVALAKYKQQTVAGAVFIHLGKKVIYKYGASEASMLALRPNNLLFWEAIRYFSDQNYEELNLGRCSLHNSGLRQFKTGWGGQEKKIHYFRFNVKKQRFTISQSGEGGSYRHILRLFPLPLLRLIGTILYRHAG